MKISFKFVVDLFVFSYVLYVYVYIFIFNFEKISDIVTTIYNLKENNTDKCAILHDLHNVLLECLIWHHFINLIFCYNFDWKMICLFCSQKFKPFFTIVFKDSESDEKFVNSLVNENIIEIITSIFDVSEDENVQVYFILYI